MKKLLVIIYCLVCSIASASDWVDGKKFDEFEVTQWGGISAPSVSPVGSGRIYYNSTANKFKVSENNGAYVDLIADLSGYVPYSGATGSVDLGAYDITATNSYFDKVFVGTSTDDSSGSDIQLGNYGISYGISTPTTYSAATLSLFSNSTYFKDINPTDMVGFTGYNLNATSDWLFKALYSSYSTDNGFIFATKAVSGTWGSADGDITFKPADTTALVLKGTDQTISLPAYTTDGFLKTSSSNGTVIVDTSTYLTKTTKTISLTIDGAGSVITTGVKGYYRVPYSGTIKSWSMAEITSTPVSTTTVIDVWKDTTANYPPTNADSITNGHEPTITAATNAVDTDLSDWTSVAVTAGDYIGFNVDSNNNAKKISLILVLEATT